MWIDAHAHLYDFDDAYLNALIDRARKAGVSTIINSGTNLSTSARVCAQCERHENLHATAGISPFDVEALEERWWDDMERLLDHPKIIAIGETGLDDSNPAYPSATAQIPVFERLLAIAHDRDLPIVIHSRGAERRVVELCRSHGVSKVLLHCYTGSVDILNEALDSGYYVSISGIATFKKGPLDEIIAHTPSNRLFVETDTPYLAPVPHRGKPNEPAFLPPLGAYVAHRKGISPQRLADAIRRNFSALFGVSQL
ncbi:MAG: YchF/TatD family DNA exonuclease [Chitinivibrionales bacterium]|nr:YchF/TatD family DNA exonuclease [Chitinivibrionales bacterium]MBD3358952.1 YchF/TatD family DNA exonuclease [Chitinivibrionales bacterium]